MLHLFCGARTHPKPAVKKAPPRFKWSEGSSSDDTVIPLKSLPQRPARRSVTCATPPKDDVPYKSPPTKAFVTNEDWASHFQEAPYKAPPASLPKQMAVQKVPVNFATMVAAGIAALTSIPGVNDQNLTTEAIVASASVSSYTSLCELAVTCYVLGVLTGVMLVVPGPNAAAARNFASQQLYALIKYIANVISTAVCRMVH